MLDGAISSASGLNRARAIEPGPAADGLHTVFTPSAAYPLVHCCAAHPPFGIITQSGAQAIYLDLSQLRREDEDPFAEAADSGTGIFAGTVQPMNLFHPSVPRPQYADDLGEDGKG